MKKGIAALVLLAAALSACSSGHATPVKAAAIASPSPVPIQFPSQILGLQVTTENITKQVAALSDTYLDSIQLFGFRQNKILRGSLQVGRFNALARPEQASFRSGIVAQFGSSVPQELHIGDRTVWLSPGQLQYQFLWFSEKWMYVFTVRRDYPFTRTLLRHLMDLSLNAR